MESRIFRKSEHPGLVAMLFEHENELERFFNYERIVNNCSEINRGEIKEKLSKAAAIGFDLNSCGAKWSYVGFYLLNDYEIINFSDFDWDLTFLEFYNKKLAKTDKQFKKLQDDELRASCAQLDVLMEREKINGQIELLETKIAEDLDIFMNKPPKLEVGQVVELRNGKMAFVLPGKLILKNGWNPLKEYDENLKNDENFAKLDIAKLDIVKIYNAPVEDDSAWSFRCTDKILLELVWERKE